VAWYLGQTVVYNRVVVSVSNVSVWRHSQGIFDRLSLISIPLLRHLGLVSVSRLTYRYHLGLGIVRLIYNPGI